MSHRGEPPAPETKAENDGVLVANTSPNAGQVLVTRAQAARRIGVSVATVRRMEGAELQPIIIDGKHVFSIEEVDRYRKVTDGDLAAQAFQMFNDDANQVDVVIALKESPERIRQLFSDWVEMSECVVVGPPEKKAHRYRWKKLLGFNLTRPLVFTCLHIVLSNPQLKARAEHELGHPIGTA